MFLYPVTKLLDVAPGSSRVCTETTVVFDKDKDYAVAATEQSLPPEPSLCFTVKIFATFRGIQCPEPGKTSTTLRYLDWQ